MESDFENNAEPDSDEIEVQVVVRDPFQKPSDLHEEAPAEPVRRARSGSHERAMESIPHTAEHVASTIGIIAPILEAISPEEAAPIEVTWPDLKLSGMLRDARGRWVAAIGGTMIREGEWLTPDVRLARADQHGVVLMHRSGATRRMNLKDEGRNG